MINVLNLIQIGFSVNWSWPLIERLIKGQTTHLSKYDIDHISKRKVGMSLRSIVQFNASLLSLKIEIIKMLECTYCLTAAVAQVDRKSICLKDLSIMGTIANLDYAVSEHHQVLMGFRTHQTAVSVFRSTQICPAQLHMLMLSYCMI